MKKPVIVLSVGLLMACTSVAAPKNRKADAVTYFALRSFRENFGNVVNVNWEVSKNFDKAIFEKNGKTIYAYFSPDGEFIGTTFQVDFSDLPEKSQQWIQRKYKNASVVDTFEFDDNEESDATMYLEGTPTDNNDNYFVVLREQDGTGTILMVSLHGVVSYFDKINGETIR